MRSPDIIPGQDRLFVANPFSGEEFFSDNSALQLSITRNAHLLDTIDHLSRASMALGLGKAATLNAGSSAVRGLEDAYGSNVDQVVTGAVTKTAPRMLLASKFSFAEADGLFQRLEDVKDDDERLALKNDTKQRYDLFVGEYYGPAKKDERKTYRARLLLEMSELTIRISEDNRDDTSVAEDTQALNTKGRLLAILSDPRAGFLPGTNHEKNRIISSLDYLDNPEYPLGIANELFQIHNRQNREVGDNPEIGGERAKESIVYEMADYYENARLVIAELDVLYEAIVAINPRLLVGLLDEVDMSSIGLRALGRFMDVSTMVFGGDKIVQTLPNPLMDKTERFKKREPGRHKFIRDQYTSREVDPKVLAQLHAHFGLTAVGGLKKLVREARKNEVIRKSFHELRLRELAGITVRDQDPLRAVAQSELDRIDADEKRTA